MLIRSGSHQGSTEDFFSRSNSTLFLSQNEITRTPSSSYGGSLNTSGYTLGRRKGSLPSTGSPLAKLKRNVSFQGDNPCSIKENSVSLSRKPSKEYNLLSRATINAFLEAIDKESGLLMRKLYPIGQVKNENLCYQEKHKPSTKSTQRAIHTIIGSIEGGISSGSRLKPEKIEFSELMKKVLENPAVKEALIANHDIRIQWIDLFITVWTSENGLLESDIVSVREMLIKSQNALEFLISCRSDTQEDKINLLREEYQNDFKEEGVWDSLEPQLFNTICEELDLNEIRKDLPLNDFKRLLNSIFNNEKLLYVAPNGEKPQPIEHYFKSCLPCIARYLRAYRDLFGRDPDNKRCPLEYFIYKNRTFLPENVREETLNFFNDQNYEACINLMMAELIPKIKGLESVIRNLGVPLLNILERCCFSHDKLNRLRAKLDKPASERWWGEVSIVLNELAGIFEAHTKSLDGRTACGTLILLVPEALKTLSPKMTDEIPEMKAIEKIISSTALKEKEALEIYDEAILTLIGENINQPSALFRECLTAILINSKSTLVNNKVLSHAFYKELLDIFSINKEPEFPWDRIAEIVTRATLETSLTIASGDKVTYSPIFQNCFRKLLENMRSLFVDEGLMEDQLYDKLIEDFSKEIDMKRWEKIIKLFKNLKSKLNRINYDKAPQLLS